MWQSSNPRARAMAKKRERQRNRKPLHIKRVTGDLKFIGSDADISHVRVVLNDITPKGVGVFCESALMVGREVALTIEEPKPIYLRARIAWCQEVESTGHIISANPCNYRIGLMFLYETAAEQAAVKQWCEAITKEFLRPSIRPAA
jgi:hypothetical protein